MSDALSGNHSLVAGAAIIGVGSTVLNSTSFVPFIGTFLALGVGFLYVFVEPLLAGGFLGMANEAVSGQASLDDFWASAKENYTDLLVARLVVGIPTLIYLVVATVVGGIVIGASVMNLVGQEGATTGAMQTFGLVAFAVFGVSFLLFAIPFFLLQFYPAAIVIGDAGPLESFKYSFLLVKKNFLSSLGYTAVAFVFGFFLLIPTVLAGGGQAVGQAVGEQLSGSVGGGFVSGFAAQLVVFAVSFFVIKTLVVVVLRTYYVSFVRAVSGTA